MKNLFFFIILFLFFTSCERVKDTTKKVINKSGETVGKGATEFIEGVSEGVDKTLQCEIKLSDRLKAKGLQTGKFSINNDTLGGKNNRVCIYLIFNKEVKETIFVKAIDKNGLEFGRVKLLVTGKTGDAKYFDFAFDKHTNIEVKSKLILE